MFYTEEELDKIIPPYPGTGGVGKEKWIPVYKLRIKQLDFLCSIDSLDFSSTTTTPLANAFNVGNEDLDGFNPSGITYTILTLSKICQFRNDFLDTEWNDKGEDKSYKGLCNFLRSIEQFLPLTLRSNTVGVNSIWPCHFDFGRYENNDYKSDTLLAEWLAKTKVWLFNRTQEILVHYMRKAALNPNPKSTEFEILNKRFKYLFDDDNKREWKIEAKQTSTEPTEKDSGGLTIVFTDAPKKNEE